MILPILRGIRSADPGSAKLGYVAPVTVCDSGISVKSFKDHRVKRRIHVVALYVE